MYTFSPQSGLTPAKSDKEVGMRVWGFTVALFLGLVMWGADVVDTTGGNETTTVVSGDDGTVRSMDGPIWPPKP
jgi:hypothetical protein